MKQNQQNQAGRITHYLLLIIVFACILCAQNALALVVSPANLATYPIKSEEVSAELPPEVDNAIRFQLSTETGITPEELKVIAANQQTWPDGCLGLAQPDEFCTQMLITGWRVVMSDGEQTWIYRTDSQGNTIRLESSQ
ncbi:MAG: hypothetical protein DSM107014_12005 [Gomphosphaeria aponina SAG 52.96 = DSM 107014]|uniref:Lipoprotein n=1 Tax=Gomphosphaeria aponina SAG 52.96 = DSM 107014 TaxID=1521640 RepID=A0A941GUH7_9CHRO|nr:hypothetical protein [Gomphosphaeria aponina SAG 52.96 = DSM 107014]